MTLKGVKNCFAHKILALLLVKWKNKQTSSAQIYIIEQFRSGQGFCSRLWNTPQKFRQGLTDRVFDFAIDLKHLH